MWSRRLGSSKDYFKKLTVQAVGGSRVYHVRSREGTVPGYCSRRLERQERGREGVHEASRVTSSPLPPTKRPASCASSPSLRPGPGPSTEGRADPAHSAAGPPSRSSVLRLLSLRTKGLRVGVRQTVS